MAREIIKEEGGHEWSVIGVLRGFLRIIGVEKLGAAASILSIPDVVKVDRQELLLNLLLEVERRVAAKPAEQPWRVFNAVIFNDGKVRRVVTPNVLIKTSIDPRMVYVVPRDKYERVMHFVRKIEEALGRKIAALNEIELFKDLRYDPNRAIGGATILRLSVLLSEIDQPAQEFLECFEPKGKTQFSTLYTPGMFKAENMRGLPKQ
ncbi:MAG: hypothetical protein ACTSWP_01085 [Candidatus Freyarchaeota archaeon]|nr:hypothetical protein [Candidatus Freyrarchaeum guaymaensis]